MQVSIKTNLPKIVAEIDELAKKQIPFAHAATLTALANRSKDKLISNLSGQFTLRRDFVKDGIRARPADKRNYPNSAAAVGSIDPFMPDQSECGIKKPTKSSSVSVPVDIRKSITDTTPKSKWPSRLSSKRPKNYAFITHNGQTWFIQRNRPGIKGKRAKPGSALAARRKAKRDQFKLLYQLEKQVHIPPRWPLRETVEREVEQNFAETFLSALSSAMTSWGGMSMRIQRNLSQIQAYTGPSAAWPGP